MWKCFVHKKSWITSLCSRAFLWSSHLDFHLPSAHFHVDVSQVSHISMFKTDFWVLTHIELLLSLPHHNLPNCLRTFPSPSPIPSPPASPNHSWIYVILYSPLPLPQLQPPWLLSWTVTVAPQVVPLVCFWYPPPILFTTAKMILLKHQSIYITSLHKNLQGFLSVFTRKSKLLPRVSEALFYILPGLLSAQSLFPPCTHLGPDRDPPYCSSNLLTPTSIQSFCTNRGEPCSLLG